MEVVTLAHIHQHRCAWIPRTIVVHSSLLRYKVAAEKACVQQPARCSHHSVAINISHAQMTTALASAHTCHRLATGWSVAGYRPVKKVLFVTFSSLQSLLLVHDTEGQASVAYDLQIDSS